MRYENYSVTQQTVNVRPLTSSDDRSEFQSGSIELDRFFQRYAGQNQFRHYIGITYVVDFDDQIGGFVTVSSGEITAESIQAITRTRLPDYPIPVLRIARLAVSRQFQGLGFGRLLFRSMLELALELKQRVGCAGVVVDAKPDAIGFYDKMGFSCLNTVAGELGDRPQPKPMFLSIRTIEKAAQAKTHAV